MQSTSRPDPVNFTQKSKVKGDPCSDIIERDAQVICRQKKNFHLTRSYLPSSGKYKVLGLNRDLLTDILTVCQDHYGYIFVSCS